MWIVYSAIPLGSGLMCFRFLQVAWWFYRTGRAAASRRRAVEGVEDDNLHPRPVRRPKPQAAIHAPLGLIIILVPLLIVADLLREKAGI